MTDGRHQIRDRFDARVAVYEASVRDGKSRYALCRIMRNLARFGIPYLRYHLARLRLIKRGSDLTAELFTGKKMLLPAHDVGSSVLAMYGISQHKSERKLALWMMNTLKDDDVFYDVGAHMGYYLALAEALLDRGEAHAFEANQELCAYLDRNFPSSQKMQVTRAAVADAPGEVDFYDATDTEDSSASSRFPVSETPIVPRKVRAITLDEYVEAGHRPPTVLKLDIEGGEYDALRGAERILRDRAPRIMMEIWGNEKGRRYSDNAVKKLQDLGYEAFLLLADGSVGESVVDPVGHISGHKADARDNILFVKK